MLDRCPHRGAKLSLGSIKNDSLHCPYHGYEFDQTGICSFSPEFNQALPGLTVRSFPVIESIGMIWIYYGKSEQAFNNTELLQLHTQFKGLYSETYRLWQSHITYCIENQLDYTHLRYVHHNTIGRGFKLPQAPESICNNKRISIYLKKDKLALDFFFPNTWILHISQKMKLMVFFVPVNEHKTLLYLRTYRTFLNVQPIKYLLDKVMNIVNLMILKQDYKVVYSQGDEPSYIAKVDKLMSHDKAIRFFREQWESLVQ